MHIRKRHNSFIQAAANNRGFSPSAMFWKRFRHNGMAIASLVVISFFALVAILGYLITPDHTPYCNQQYLELASLKPFSKATFLCIPIEAESEKRKTENKFRTLVSGVPLDHTSIPVEEYSISGDSIHAVPYNGDPITASCNKACVKTRTFILGTDTYGRDLLSQVMIGSRVSLSVGFVAVAIALLIGIFLGALAAYYGGWVDSLILWLVNVVWSIPTVLLVIAITFALGKGFWQVFVAIGLTVWVDVARVVRGQVLGIKEKEYIEAARALGYRTPRIIIRHILPNITGPVVVIAASNFASAILLEAGLSFLGIGVQPPMPSWGTMVKENYGQILLDNAHLAFIPGIAIMLIVLAFMLLASGIRDALDIKA